MKKFILYVATLCACAHVHAQFAFELQGQVAHVLDGDTIILHPGGKHVRLAEIDAPETSHGDRAPGQPYGATARAALAAMMPVGSEVKTRCYEHDARGRAVCRVLFGDIDISLEMVRLGHAHAYREYARDPRILGAGEHAKAGQLGLWRGGDAVYPQTWRRNCWNAPSPPLYCSVNDAADSPPMVLAANATTPFSPIPNSGGSSFPKVELPQLAALVSRVHALAGWLATVRLP